MPLPTDVLAVASATLCAAALIKRAADALITTVAAVVAILARDPKRNHRAMAVLRMMLATRSRPLNSEQWPASGGNRTIVGE